MAGKKKGAATEAGTTASTSTENQAAGAEVKTETPKKEKPAKIEQNGVVRPSSGATLKVWDIADQISAQKKAPAERKEVTEAGLNAGLVVGTIHTQYGKWRKFHGLAKVVEKSAPAAAEGGEANQAAE